MTPANYFWNFVAGDGAQLRGAVTVGGVAYNLTGCTAQLDIRTGNSSTPLVFTASTANGKIVLGGVLGTYAVTLTATETLALSNLNLKYDLKIIDATGKPMHWIEGDVRAKAPVTP